MADISVSASVSGSVAIPSVADPRILPFPAPCREAAYIQCRADAWRSHALVWRAPDLVAVVQANIEVHRAIRLLQTWS